MRDRRMGVGCAMPAIADPLLWRHLIGRNVETCGADHTVWGTDCLWWGSRQ